MSPLVSIINLILPTISCDAYQEGKLIRQLNNHFNFDHNIFLLNTSADVNRFVDPTCNREFTPQSWYDVSGNTDDHLTELASLTNATSTNPFVIVVPESSKFANNLDLLNRMKRIQRVRLDMKFGVFFRQTASTEDVRELFEWSWKNRIINIFAVTYPPPETQLHILTYNPLTNQFNSDENQMLLYPMEVLLMGLVVPEALPYAEFAAYLQTITSDELFGYSIATIAVVMVLLTWFRYIKQKRILIFQSVTDVLNLLMNDDGAIKY